MELTYSSLPPRPRLTTEGTPAPIVLDNRPSQTDHLPSRTARGFGGGTERPSPQEPPSCRPPPSYVVSGSPSYSPSYSPSCGYPGPRAHDGFSFYGTGAFAPSSMLFVIVLLIALCLNTVLLLAVFVALITKT